MFSIKFQILAMPSTAIVFGLAACSDNFMSSKLKDESTLAVTLTATVDEAGNYNTSLASDATTTQVMRVTDGDLAGSAISMPPGALSISVDVTVGEGETLASSDTMQQLGITSNAVSAAGPSVSFMPSTDVEASTPFTLAIPLSGTSLWLAGVDTSNLIVMFKQIRVAGGVTSYEMGLIPGSALTVGAASVQFQTTRFGIFQLAVTETKITQAVSKPTAEPPTPRVDSNNPLVGVWGVCRAAQRSGSSSTDEKTALAETPPDSQPVLSCSASVIADVEFTANAGAANYAYLKVSAASSSSNTPMLLSAGSSQTLVSRAFNDETAELVLSSGCHFVDATTNETFGNLWLTCGTNGVIKIVCDGTTSDQGGKDGEGSSSSNGSAFGVADSATVYHFEYVKFSSSTFVHSKSTYDGADCTGTLLTQKTETGSYSLEAVQSDGYYPATIVSKTATGTIFTDDGVALANGSPDSKGCGLSGWVKAQTKDLMTTICNEEDEDDFKMYFKPDGNTLDMYNDGGSGDSDEGSMQRQ